MGVEGVAIFVSVTSEKKRSLSVFLGHWVMQQKKEEHEKEKQVRGGRRGVGWMGDTHTYTDTADTAYLKCLLFSAVVGLDGHVG
jgi:hypothetical protein